jgi:hypothetical protein
MRVRWLYLIFALIAAAFVPRSVARADLNYRTEITGVEDTELADLLDKISELKTLEDKPPVSEEALRRRADRDLGRLADAAHILGYWDAEFSYDINAEANPAKITVTVEPGPLYHVASVKVLGATSSLYRSPKTNRGCRSSPATWHALPRWWRPRWVSWRHSAIAAIPSPK